jgi:hypothetical protein
VKYSIAVAVGRLLLIAHRLDAETKTASESPTPLLMPFGNAHRQLPDAF